ncbi:signal peptidase I [Urechidicola croceus]|uniref:Signal peptidase I n=1 Tax=Urechidicola croceus TaxID=1850246 RepID=A0A1D8P6M5_9FLAO|nr:signal peptidase I [Urechidicola croceus]AOW20218.1 signal peptidase I [Urechidicola croceus]
MTIMQWFIFFLIIQVIHFLGTWKLYVKAGKKAWEAAIPVYNAVVLMDIINRPRWWVILLFIPIVNLLMFPILWIETIRSFGKNTRFDTTLVLITLGFYIYYVNYFTDVEHIKNRSLKPRSVLGDWVSSIAFAIIAATLVHTYVMRPFTIPTSSLEKSLLIGDFLFVSKFHYGARTPMTPLALPMVHDSMPSISIPFTGLKTPSFVSHFKKPQLPYFRLPGLQKIKRNEIVVFNWPADSLKWMWNDNSGKFTYKPIDKKTNYVKRCVAIAGDSLQIIDGDIYINGKLSIMPDRAKPQYNYIVDTDGKQLNTRSLRQRYNVREGYIDNNGKYVLNLTDEEVELVRKNPLVKSATKQIEPSGTFNKKIFPHNEQYPWSSDNFGPIYIPEKGATVELNSKSIPFYEHLIREYENNDLTIDNNNIYINGKIATNYTFKQDYYWMMGDNRQNSLDARSYGFTPFDHVIGKPVFIWFSWETNGKGLKEKIRWERLFTTVHGSGKPVSYFFYFIGAIAVYFIYRFIKKRRA